MSKKPDAASALAGILKARREPEPITEEPEINHSPAPPPTDSKNRRGGKSSDPEFTQCSVYLPRKLRKQVGRALDDEDKGRDFSGLVKTLLDQWLSSRT